MTDAPWKAASIQLLIADDHPLIRSGMRAQIEPLGGSQRFTVHEAGDAMGLRQALAKAQACQQPVDLALVDLMMPGMQGAQTAVELAQAYPQVAFLIVTGLPHGSWIHRLREQSNIRGVLGKNHGAADLRRAIDLALAGVQVWEDASTHPAALPITFNDINSGAFDADFIRANGGFEAESATPDALTALSPRQRDVSVAVARGLSNAQIAAELGLTQGTVKAYLKDIFKALGVSNRTQLALRLRQP
jgi:DNA-binding NarL/FixJ family response regulator